MGKISINYKETKLRKEATIFDFADDLDIKVPTSCGRVGSCHECIVEIKEGIGALTPKAEQEQFLEENFRLSCQAKIADSTKDIQVLTLVRRPKILTFGEPKKIELDPVVKRRGEVVLYNDEEIDQYRDKIYGIAADIGTTTIVMSLMDLQTGEEVANTSFENPQMFGGSDIMHRIQYENEHQNGELNKVLLAYINNEIRDFPCRRNQIYEMVAVGNATMRDIFFKISVKSIGEKPYKSVTEIEMEQGKRSTTSLSARAFKTGVRINRKGKVYGAPLVGCHVGADAASCLVSTGMLESDEPNMLVDIGTNTEVLLGNRDRMLVASCPAGPAFEGGGITYGMPGLEGAIESASFDNGKLRCSTIGGIEPRGICGSGLIDLMAELLRKGRLDQLTRFTDGVDKYTVAEGPKITLSRKDLSELAQAKAANYSGQQILLRKSGISLDKIKKFYFAGGFANYMTAENAIAIGLIPPFPKEKIVKVGNAALEGAKEILLSKQRRQFLETEVKKIEHIELEQEADFFEIFTEGCMLKPMEL